MFRPNVQHPSHQLLCGQCQTGLAAVHQLQVAGFAMGIIEQPYFGLWRTALSGCYQFLSFRTAQQCRALQDKCTCSVVFWPPTPAQLCSHLRPLLPEAAPCPSHLHGRASRRALYNGRCTGRPNQLAAPLLQRDGEDGMAAARSVNATGVHTSSKVAGGLNAADSATTGLEGAA